MKKSDMKFSDAMSELELINKKLESEDVELEESLELFEKGLKLAEFCQVRLKEIENKFIELRQKSEKLEVSDIDE